MTKQSDFEADICNPGKGGGQPELLYSEFNTSLGYLEKVSIKKRCTQAVHYITFPSNTENTPTHH